MLERMNKKRMRTLGRRGGLKGGRARARTLSARRKSEIARAAARARWQPKALVLTQPRDHGELQCFVAFYGNGLTQADDGCDPVTVLLRAVVASRNDGGLARMLPIFIWRTRDILLGRPKELTAVCPEDACALGYFLELTCKLGGFQAAGVLKELRRKAKPVKDPFVFFRLMDASMLREFAMEHTSPLAKSWKLVLGEPDESFESYFAQAKKFHAAL